MTMIQPCIQELQDIQAAFPFQQALLGGNKLVRDFFLPKVGRLVSSFWVRGVRG